MKGKVQRGMMGKAAVGVGGLALVGGGLWLYGCQHSGVPAGSQSAAPEAAPSPGFGRPPGAVGEPAAGRGSAGAPGPMTTGAPAPVDGMQSLRSAMPDAVAAGVPADPSLPVPTTPAAEAAARPPVPAPATPPAPAAVQPTPPGAAPGGGGGGQPGIPGRGAPAAKAVPETPVEKRRAFVQLPDVAGGMPDASEEVWVIRRFVPERQQRRADAPVGGEDAPGFGAMVTTVSDASGTRLIPIPLQHTGVNAQVAGIVSSTTVVQQYANPFSGKIEAVYVFPLPENAAVNDFVMTIGERRIRGVIRDRAEAERIYTEARAQGKVASLMSQDRPNIFTQRVANIEPGKRIDVTVTYYHTVSMVDGEMRWVFPMVVGPRFNPEGTYDGVGAVGRGGSGGSRQQTEVAYLRPGERAANRVSVTLDVHAGVGGVLGRVWSDSHVVQVAPGGADRARVTLSNTDNLPNKDLVVKWTLAGEGLRNTLTTFAAPDGFTYFQQVVHPPARADFSPRQPVELVFVLDCSGSMSGRPIEQAVAAVERGLRRLTPADTFQVINFAAEASALGPAPIPASADNVQRGVQYLKSLYAQGGTYMVTGLRASLDFPQDPSRQRFVVFLTDGYSGNEREILSEIDLRLSARRSPGDDSPAPSTRIFSFGVGTSTNRYLLDAMAKVGRGAVAHMAAGDNPSEVMDLFFDRISRPAMTDLSVTLGSSPWTNVGGAEVYPRVLPDVFAGRPVVITGRVPTAAIGGGLELRVAGRTGGWGTPVVTQSAMLTAGPGAATHPAIPALWARRKIADLADYATFATMAGVPEAVKGVALNFNLLSGYTSFIAVDSMSSTAGSFGTTVPVPVNMPEGVRYETTVGPR
ncbi:MAG: VIT domain-containing protein [bacterium]